jgi:altronate dehydratase small subunit
MAMSQAVIVVDRRDNVATALRPLQQGESVRVELGGKTVTIPVRQAVSFGHKIALTRLEKGDEVRKYGEIIGLATQPIAPGQHVHVHNVKGPETGRHAP